MFGLSRMEVKQEWVVTKVCTSCNVMVELWYRGIQVEDRPKAICKCGKEMEVCLVNGEYAGISGRST